MEISPDHELWDQGNGTWKHHRGEHQCKAEALAFPFDSGKSISRHGRRQKRTDQAARNDCDRVNRISSEISSLESVRVVAPEHFLWPEHEGTHAVNVRIFHKGRTDHPVERDYADQSQKNNHRIDCRLFYIVGSFSSSLLHLNHFPLRSKPIFSMT